MRFDVLHLSVADLDLTLDLRDCDADVILPDSYHKFLQPVANPQAEFVDKTLHNNQTLDIQLHDEPGGIDPGFTLVSKTDIWELYREHTNNRLLFYSPRGNPPCQLIVDEKFTHGDLFGDFSECGQRDVFPLLGLDNLVYINWLASLNDVSLHASAVVIDGSGYGFFGVSGVGKSTLARALNQTHAALVLGEDQVFLRCIDDQFWIFGTPWHENVNMCAAYGVPLRKLFFLIRGDHEDVNRLKPTVAVSQVLRTAFIPYYRPELLPGILARLESLVLQVPIYSLSYHLGEDIWDTLRNV